MKKLLLLPLVLLSFGVSANERVILASFERESADADDIVSSAETTLNGFGIRFYNFGNRELYFGAGFTQSSGDFELCVLQECDTGDTSATLFSGEVGRNLGSWTPFVGANFTSAEVEILGFTESDESWGLNAGLWLDLDTVKLRGAITDLDDSDSRAVFGGFLYQMDNSFALGAVFGVLLDSEVDGFRFSLQFGRKF